MGWAAIIFSFSAIPQSGEVSRRLLSLALSVLSIQISHHSFELIHYSLRKFAHVTEYALLSLLIYACFRQNWRFEWRPRKALWCIVISAAYALTDEFHQRFVFGRTGSWLDFGLDVTGAALAMLGLYILDRLVRRSLDSTGLSDVSAAETADTTAGR